MTIKKITSRSIAVITALLLLLIPTAQADEGMWSLHKIDPKTYQAMQKMGLNLIGNEIYDNGVGSSITDAIIQFGNGCSGSVISKNGLIITNHHCGHGYIQQVSTVENNYLEKGFYAQNLEDEIPIPGLTVTFVRSIHDITDSIVPRIGSYSSEDQRAQIIDSLAYATAQHFIKLVPNYSVSVKPMFKGNRFYLYCTQTYKDVRLVLAPPASIGSFGGDTDNWNYPRHTNDFSQFRIYADQNDQPAEYSRDNKPLTPKRYLSVSLDGYQENDFALIIGFPGTTTRYITSYELENRMNITNKHRAIIRGEKQNAWKKRMDQDPKVRLQYAAKYKQSSNYWKNAIGMNQALKRENVMQKKKTQEQQFVNWYAQTAEKTNLYASTLNDIQQATADLKETLMQRMYFIEALYMGIEFTNIYSQFAALKKHIDGDNKEAIEKLLAHAQSTLKNEWFKDYDPETDRQTAKVMLALVKQNLPENLQPELYKSIIEKNYNASIDQCINDIFDNSILVDYEKLTNFLKKPNEKLLKKDPGFLFCESFFNDFYAINTRLKPLSHKLNAATRKYMQGIMQMAENEPIYPDANSTIRFTYGQVKGYHPKDAVTYRYYTTLDGLFEKVDNENPDFRIPTRLKDLYDTKNFNIYYEPPHEMRVNFTTTNDITGGNSGSPVLDANGNLIGLAFDGNWESLSGDIDFSDELQRCINVDIRYVMFIVHQYFQANRIIDEIHFVHNRED